MTTINEVTPHCSHCGRCCRALGLELPMLREDYRRWKKQRRQDILRYAWIPDLSDGWGDLWIDPKSGQELLRCPFLKHTKNREWSCAIEDTKPGVCKEFWCEYAYGVGTKGVMFKSLNGRSQKAKEMGYEKLIRK